MNYKVAGFLDTNSKNLGKSIDGIKILGNSDDIFKITKNERIDEIIIADGGLSSKDIEKISDICMQENILCKRTRRLFFE